MQVVFTWTFWPASWVPEQLSDYILWIHQNLLPAKTVKCNFTVTANWGSEQQLHVPEFLFDYDNNSDRDRQYYYTVNHSSVPLLEILLAQQWLWWIYLQSFQCFPSQIYSFFVSVAVINCCSDPSHCFTKGFVSLVRSSPILYPAHQKKIHKPLQHQGIEIIILKKYKRIKTTYKLQAFCLIVCLIYIFVLVCKKTVVLWLNRIRLPFFAHCQHLWLITRAPVAAPLIFLNTWGPAYNGTLPIAAWIYTTVNFIQLQNGCISKSLVTDQPPFWLGN